MSAAVGFIVSDRSIVLEPLEQSLSQILSSKIPRKNVSVDEGIWFEELEPFPAGGGR